jgi:hypothetical protein
MLRQKISPLAKSGKRKLPLIGETMKKTTIDKLCEELNKARRVQYPQRGYTYFADIKGDGRNIRRVYVITGDAGGVTTCHNGATYRQTAKNLREVLAVQSTF